MTARVPPLHLHHTNRNPWGGTASTSSAVTYHNPADCWYEPQYCQPARTPSPQYDVIEGPRLNRHAMIARAVTPGTISTAASSRAEAVVDPCGGHCRTFETFCHYCLQVAFIGGILTGISLVIAGSVLRGPKRGGDLMVLVYIGCLTSLVCSLLLSVQCCVRRNVKRRKRARPTAIPLRDLGPPQPPLPLPHCEPLLLREDRSGTPWWRRQPQPNAGMPKTLPVRAPVPL